MQAQNLGPAGQGRWWATMLSLEGEAVQTMWNQSVQSEAVMLRYWISRWHA